MKTKIIFSIICVIIGFYACDDNIPEKLEFEQFKKLYFSAASDEAKTITLPSTRDTSFVFGNIAYGGTTWFGQGNITAEIGADFSLVDTYNTENKTEYESLPEENFAFSNVKLVIENGGNYSSATQLFLAPEGMDTEKSYLLPVTIKSVTGNVPVNEDKKTVYCIIAFSDAAQPVVDFEMKTWEVVESHNDWNADHVAEKLIDGDPMTAWHTALDGMPKWVIFDMQKERKIKGLNIWHRKAPAAGDHGASPKDMKFEISKDNQTWTTLGETEFSKQPEAYWMDASYYVPVEMTNPASGRYLKIYISTNWSDAGYTYLGEIHPF